MLYRSERGFDSFYTWIWSDDDAINRLSSGMRAAWDAEGVDLLSLYVAGELDLAYVIASVRPWQVGYRLVGKQQKIKDTVTIGHMLGSALNLKNTGSIPRARVYGMSLVESSIRPPETTMAYQILDIDGSAFGPFHGNECDFNSVYGQNNVLRKLAAHYAQMVLTHWGLRNKPRLLGSPDDCLGPGEGWNEVPPFINTPEKATALYIMINTTYHIDATGRSAKLIGKCRDVELKELGVICDGWPSTTQSKGDAI